MLCFGFEPGASGWLALTIPLCYSSRPMKIRFVWKCFCKESILVQLASSLTDKGHKSSEPLVTIKQPRYGTLGYLTPNT